MSDYKPKHMLITGGAGFIGSNFIRYILNNESTMTVVNLDKLTYAGSMANIKDLPNFKHYHFIEGDINDKKCISHVLQHHQIDTIVHFAAESHVDRSIVTPNVFVDSNVVGTFNLLEAARHHWFDIDNYDHNHCRFHHISTDEVYGSLNIDDPAFVETSPYLPRSPYAATKAGSDHLVNAYYHTYGLPITISNCSNNFGPYQHDEKFIPTIIHACLREKVIPIYGNGKNRRDWIYVEDHCRAILTILKHGKIGQQYNIGAGNEWENLSLAQYICQKMDVVKPMSENASYCSLIQNVTDRMGHDFRYAINSNKIKNDLNWRAEIPFEVGINKTIDFYLNS